MAEEGQLLALLVRLTGAARVLEVGTYTGTAPCAWPGAAPEGRLVTCDITDRWPSIGADYWKRAGVDHKIETRIGAAAETLAELLAEYGEGGFDLVFIDADKSGYAEYYERSLALLRPGGLIVVDNTLYFGRVTDPAARTGHGGGSRAERPPARRRAGGHLLLPMADGITLVRKRSE
ncbi:class I SAM-dependent methyltransferase [Streptomyces sp. M19]